MYELFITSSTETTAGGIGHRVNLVKFKAFTFDENKLAKSGPFVQVNRGGSKIADSKMVFVLVTTIIAVHNANTVDAHDTQFVGGGARGEKNKISIGNFDGNIHGNVGNFIWSNVNIETRAEINGDGTGSFMDRKRKGFVKAFEEKLHYLYISKKLVAEDGSTLVK